MSTQTIADRLVELCRQGEYMKAQQELYADDAVSIEPEGSPWKSEEGLEALHGKVELWARPLLLHVGAMTGLLGAIPLGSTCILSPN